MLTDLCQKELFTMKKTDLHESFLNLLNNSSRKKSELVSLIGDILKIERESAYRRLNGKVLFTVQEMGMIAQSLNISIDSLLSENTNFLFVPIKMGKPLSHESIDTIIDILEYNINKMALLNNEVSVHMGVVFDTLPIEFCIPHPYLCKFKYFKLGHYYVGKDFNRGYSEWALPERIEKFHQIILDNFWKYETIFYIWDIPVIWNLINDIKYLYSIRILSKDDVENIKKDIHELLYVVEGVAKGTHAGLLPRSGPIEFYLSSINIGLTYYTFFSDEKALAYFRSYFVRSALTEEYNTCMKIYEWVNSMKKVSTLISESGEKDRRIFFEEQHTMVDSI